MSKKTLVIGASLKPHRYSNIAIKKLTDYKNEVVAIGLREGIVDGIRIFAPRTKEALYDLDWKGIHTITLYLSPARQVLYYKYIISLNPTRVIFNPNTENEYFYSLLDVNNIAYEIACTLVLLATKQY